MQKFIVDDPLASRWPEGGPAQSASRAADASYDSDFALWLAQQALLLRAERFPALDLANLIEELESMGKSEQRELRSRLETLVMHLLKCEFQPAMKSGSWQATLLEQRARIDDLLSDSPSLRSRVAALISDCYGNAVGRAALETGIVRATFPPHCAYSIEQVLDSNFVP